MNCQDQPEKQGICSYVVRVYRRDGLTLAGTVVDCMSGNERVFHDSGELVAAMTGPAHGGYGERILESNVEPEEEARCRLTE